MSGLHAKALRTFANRLYSLFLLRAGVKGATVWLFLWGVVVLVVKTSTAHQPAWLGTGLLGVFPAAFLAAWHARNSVPAFIKIRANYDRLNACGGMIMSEEAADMSDWLSRLPRSAAP
jgi:integral membrane sensor domain MASE1